MSVYTTELQWIIVGLTDEMPTNTPLLQRIDTARQKIFDFNYPIWDENHKVELETKIIEHYLFREIGLDTYMKWKIKLRSKMMEIMPYYVDKYNSIYPYLSKLYVNEDYKEESKDDRILERDDTFNETQDLNVVDREEYTDNQNMIEETIKSINETEDYTEDKDIDKIDNAKSNETDDTIRKEISQNTGHSSENGGYSNTETNGGNRTTTKNGNSENTRTDDLAHDISLDRTDTTHNDSVTDTGNLTSNISENDNKLNIHSDLPQSALHVIQEGQPAGSQLLPITNKAFAYDYATYSDQSQGVFGSRKTENTDNDKQSTGNEVKEHTFNETNTGTVNNVEESSENERVEESQNNKLTNTNNKISDNSENSDTDFTDTTTKNITSNATNKETGNLTGNKNSRKNDNQNSNANKMGSGNVNSERNDTKNTDNNRKIIENDNSKHTNVVIGLRGKTYSELISEYQQSIVNIDMEIINKLSCLFMNIF